MDAAGVPRASHGGRLRLTRRGRLVVTILLLLLVATAAAVLSPASRAADPGAGAPAGRPGAAGPPDGSGAGAPEIVVVQPGDSLWSVAERHRPERDPTVVVEELRRLNGLGSAPLQVGQRLILPVVR